MGFNSGFKGLNYGINFSSFDNTKKILQGLNAVYFLCDYQNKH